MTLEALSSNGLLNFLLSETLSPTPFKSLVDLEASPENNVIISKNTTPAISHQLPAPPRPSAQANRGKKRRRRKPRVCKNEEEAENQRMTHIAVERNRRRQMNQHLSVLRSLMPQPFAQKVLSLWIILIIGFQFYGNFYILNFNIWVSIFMANLGFSFYEKTFIRLKISIWSV